MQFTNLSALWVKHKVSYRIIPYHIISYHFISHHIISYREHAHDLYYIICRRISFTYNMCITHIYYMYRCDCMPWYDDLWCITYNYTLYYIIYCNIYIYLYWSKLNLCQGFLKHQVQWHHLPRSSTAHERRSLRGGAGCQTEAAGDLWRWKRSKSDSPGADDFCLTAAPEIPWAGANFSPHGDDFLLFCKNIDRRTSCILVSFKGFKASCPMTYHGNGTSPYVCILIWYWFVHLTCAYLCTAHGDLECHDP